MTTFADLGVSARLLTALARNSIDTPVTVQVDAIPSLGTGKLDLPEGMASPRVVVLGHTHELDSGPDYVNLGTWAARASDATGPLDATLPLLRIEADQKQLRAQLLDVSQNWRTFQRFEVNR